MTTSSYGLGRDFNAPIAFPEAVLTLRAVSPAVWDALPPDVLVAERQAELAVARLLAGAREAAEADDWEAIGPRSRGRRTQPAFARRPCIPAAG